VLWGGCPDDPDQLALHVDLRQKFGPDEVLGDDSYAIDLSTADRNRPVILARAFVNLLDGATLDAAASLSGFVTNAWRGQAPDERDPQVSALALLAANCFLFAEEYEDAIAAYDVLLGADADGNVDDEALDAALKADWYVAMALYNRGLANANAWAAILNAAYQSSTGRELDDFAGAALADFDRLGEVVSEGDPTAATVLAPALSQHGIVFGWVESSADSDFEEYFDRCDDAMALAPDLALGYICWASLQYWKTDLQGGDGEGTDLALAHLDTAAGLAVSPPEIAYWRGQLYYQLADSQENPTDQADYYARGDESLIDFMRASQTEPVLLGLDHEMRRFAGNSVEGWAD
jgi:tetratricopeptide (TPR) repeat protein